MPRITLIRIFEETEPAWDRGNVPWIVRVAVRWAIAVCGFVIAREAVNYLYDEDKWFIDDVWALLTCPLQLLTLGLFIFVINAVIILIVEWISDIFDIGFEVAGFFPAFIGALFISAVSFIIDRFLRFNPIGPDLRT